MNNDPVALNRSAIASVRIEKGSVIHSKRRDLLRHRGNIIFAERPGSGVVQGVMRNVVEKKMPYGPPHYFVLLELINGVSVEFPVFGTTFYSTTVPENPKGGGIKRSKTLRKSRTGLK